MKNKKGFTLIEMLVAVMIFSMAIISLGLFWLQAYRYSLQTSKSHYLKNNLVIAMRYIQNDVSASSRIDLPSDLNPSTQLKGAINVDKLGGCKSNTSLAASWFYYCYDSGAGAIYRYWGNVTGIAGCMDRGAYTPPSITCGEAPPTSGSSQAIAFDVTNAYFKIPAADQTNRVIVYMETVKPATATTKLIRSSATSEFKSNANIS
ncbi:MAG: prepilin-type N-terminal cleavage/methylation domain-containing protein [Elusimicrobia bacterium]|nr:prepilin-type N-terminal cleavage/methylation domain-containing protein [Elusimicrobiota bacterium]